MIINSDTEYIKFKHCEDTHPKLVDWVGIIVMPRTTIEMEFKSEYPVYFVIATPIEKGRHIIRKFILEASDFEDITSIEFFKLLKEKMV